MITQTEIDFRAESAPCVAESEARALCDLKSVICDPTPCRSAVPSARNSASAPPSLPPDFLAIVGILGRCRGKANAMTAPQIATAAAIPGKGADTKVRHLISAFYDHFPFIVCGDSTGFFVPLDSEIDELDHQRRSFYSRLRCLAARIHSFDKLTNKYGYERTGTGPNAKYTRKQYRKTA